MNACDLDFSTTCHSPGWDLQTCKFMSDLPVAWQPYVGPVARHDLGGMGSVCLKCGALHWLNEHLQKSRSNDLYLLFGMCSGDGSVELPAPPPPPDSQHRPQRHGISVTTSASTMPHSPSHLLELGLTTVSIEPEVGPQCSRSMVNSSTRPVPFSLPTENHCLCVAYVALPSIDKGKPQSQTNVCALHC